MMKKYDNVDAYIAAQDNFRETLLHLRNLISTTDLKEAIKWGMPVFTINGKNVVGFSAFKKHCGLWFYQGALLSDPYGVLTNAQEGKTQAMRHWKFDESSNLDDDKILEYLLEAIENEKQGKRVKFKKIPVQFTLPEPLSDALLSDGQLKESFETLTPGKRKEYCEYIASAKREATVNSRMSKIVPMIKRGVGLNDMYKR